MKSILLSFLTSIVLFGCVATEKEMPAPQVPITMQVFYDELSPYGKWVSHPTYGYVWYPMDDPDTFLPYGTNGHWVWTEYGWTWVSEYRWGWAPFHYGRWDYDPLYGWFWIPDVVWGPAWVVWCTSGDYYGWAPMGPRVGISIVIAGRWMPPAPWWVFVHHRHMGHPHIRDYYERRERYGRIIGESRVITNTHDDRGRGITNLSGPDRTEVEKQSGRSVRPLPITERTSPGQSEDDKSVGFYRPVIQQVPDRQPKPQRVEDTKNLRSVPPTPRESEPWKGPQRDSKTRPNPDIHPQPTPRQEPKVEPARPQKPSTPDTKTSVPRSPQPKAVPKPKDSQQPAQPEPRKNTPSSDGQKRSSGNK